MEPKLLARKAKPFFRFDPVTSILGLIAVFFSSQLVVALLMQLYPLIKHWDEAQSKQWLADSVVAQFMFYLLTELLVVYMVYNLVRLARRNLSDIGLVSPQFFDVVRALIGWAVYFGLLILVMMFASNMTSIPEQEQNIGFDKAKSLSDLIMVFLALAVIVPIAEEMMFRGFLFTSLRAKYSFWPSALATSVVFGAAHLYSGSESPLLWVVAVDTLILSVIMCYLRERTASLWPSILIHMLKNGIAFVALFGARIV